VAKGKEGKNPDFTELLTEIYDLTQAKLASVFDQSRNWPDPHTKKTGLAREAAQVMRRADEFIPPENPSVILIKRPVKPNTPAYFRNRLREISHGAVSTFRDQIEDIFYHVHYELLDTNSITPDRIETIFISYFGSFNMDEEEDDYLNTQKPRQIHGIYNEMVDWLQKTFIEELEKAIIPSDKNELTALKREHSEILPYALRKKMYLRMNTITGDRAKLIKNERPISEIDTDECGKASALHRRYTRLKPDSRKKLCGALYDFIEQWPEDLKDSAVSNLEELHEFATEEIEPYDDLKGLRALQAEIIEWLLIGASKDAHAMKWQGRPKPKVKPDTENKNEVVDDPPEPEPENTEKLIPVSRLPCASYSDPEINYICDKM
jgi:hypothetical protein